MSDMVYYKRERRIVALFLLFVTITLIRFLHANYQAMYDATVFYLSNHPGVPINNLYAPDAYRVGMRFLSGLLMRWLHMSPVGSSSVCDFFFGFAALWLGYRLTVADLSLSPERRPTRFIAIACYLGAMQLALNWVAPYQRPETLATAFYVVALANVLMRIPEGSGWFLMAVALTVWQSFVRSDVPCFLGFAIVLFGLVSVRSNELASRKTLVLLGGTMSGVAVAVQSYMQFVRYPHLSYVPGNEVFMLFINLKPHFLSSLLIVLTPLVCVFAAALALKISLRPIDLLLVIAAALYVPLWLTVGSAAEPRIFVPFLLAVSPGAARVLTSIMMPAITRSTSAVSDGRLTPACLD